MEKQRKTIQLPAGFDLKKYDDMGVDISLLLATLRKTPTERCQDNEAMLAFIQEAKKNWKHLNVRS